MESALTTSPRKASAIASPADDLPAAVGPTTATTLGTGPGGDEVADAVRRRGVVQRRPPGAAAGGAGQHLPGRSPADQQLVVQRRVQREQRLGVGGGQRAGDGGVVRLSPGVEVAGRLLGTAGRAVAHDEQTGGVETGAERR